MDGAVPVLTFVDQMDSQLAKMLVVVRYPLGSDGRSVGYVVFVDLRGNVDVDVDGGIHIIAAYIDLTGFGFAEVFSSDEE